MASDARVIVSSCLQSTECTVAFASNVRSTILGWRKLSSFAFTQQRIDDVTVKYHAPHTAQRRLFFQKVGGFLGFLRLPYLLRGVADEQGHRGQEDDHPGQP